MAFSSLRQPGGWYSSIASRLEPSSEGFKVLDFTGSYSDLVHEQYASHAQIVPT